MGYFTDVNSIYWKANTGTKIGCRNCTHDLVVLIWKRNTGAFSYEDRY